MNGNERERSTGKATGRRWLQFSLSALFLALTAICVVLGLLNQRVEQQRQAITAIRALGGWAGYNGTQESMPWGPNLAWLSRRLPREFLGSITSEAMFVDLQGTSAGDADMPLVPPVRHVVWLRLDGTTVGDEGLARLSGFTHLKILRLYGTRVTDAGLAHLESLRHLEYLDVGGTVVSESAVADLQRALPGCAIVR
jgi:hypothetical protein